MYHKSEVTTYGTFSCTFKFPTYGTCHMNAHIYQHENYVMSLFCYSDTRFLLKTKKCEFFHKCRQNAELSSGCNM